MIAERVEASPAEDDVPRANWTAALADPVRIALEAREEVYRRVPRGWWPWSIKRLLTLHAVEVYVRTVLLAYARGSIEGWPPGPEGQPTVDFGLKPRRRRTSRRRPVRIATAR